MILITDLHNNTLPLKNVDKFERKRATNGDYEITMQVKRTEDNKAAFDLIKTESIIAYKDNSFRVKELNKETLSDGVVRIEITQAWHVLYDSVDTYQHKIITGEKVLSIHQALTHALEGTGLTFIVKDDFDTISFENYGDDNSSSLFQEAMSKFGFEFSIDNNHFTIVKQVGKNNGKQMRYKHNIQTISVADNTKDLSTKIVGYGKLKEDDEGNQIDGEYVVTDEYISPNADLYGIREATPYSNEKITHKPTLRKYLISKLQDEPVMTFQIGYTELVKNLDTKLEDTQLGDVITLIHEPMSLKFSIRIVEVIDNPLHTHIKPIYTLSTHAIELGGDDKNTSNAIGKQQTDKDIAGLHGKQSEIGKRIEGAIEAVSDVENSMIHVESEMERIENEVIPEIEQSLDSTMIPSQPEQPYPIPTSLLWNDTSINPSRMMRWDKELEEWVVLAPTESEVDKIISDMRAQAKTEDREYTDAEIKEARSSIETELAEKIGDVNTNITNLETISDNLKKQTKTTDDYIANLELGIDKDNTQITTDISDLKDASSSLIDKSNQIDLEVEAQKEKVTDIILDLTNKADLEYVDGQLVSKVSKEDYELERQEIINDLLDKADTTDVEKKLKDKVNQFDYDTKLKGITDDLADKTDLEYVDGQLTGKADQEFTYTKIDVDDALNKRVTQTEYDTDQSGVVDRFKDNESSITQNATNITNKVSQTEYDTDINDVTGGLKKKLSDAESSISQNATDITSRVTQTTYDKDINHKTGGLKNKVSEAESSITQNATAIESKVEQTEFDAVEGRVGNAESSITQQADEIKSKVEQSEFDLVEGRVDTAESTITQQAGFIEAKVEQTEYNKNKEGVASDIVDNKAAITAASDEIKLRVTKDEMQEGIDAIEIGGRNLVKNSEKMILHGSREIYKNPKIDQEYTVSFDYEIIEGDPTSFLLYGSAGLWEDLPIDKRPKGRVEFNFTPTSDAHAPSLRIYSGKDSAESGTVTVKLTFIQLEKGNKATDWSPAPEDIEERVSSSEAEIKVNADNITSKVAQTDFNAVEGRVNTAESTISQHATQITSKVSKTDYDIDQADVVGRLSNAESSITQTETDITSKVSNTKYNADKKASDALISGHTTSINQNADAITSKAEKTYVDTETGKVDSKVSEVIQTAEEISSKVGTLETEQTALGTKVGKHDTAITQNATDIGLRVESTEYDKDKQGINKNIQDNKAAIDLSDKEIALRVTKDEMQEGIDAIEVGGRNLAIGTGESKNWDSYSNGTVTSTDKKTMRATMKTKGIFGMAQSSSFRKMSLTEGVEYTLSFEIRASFKGDANYIYIMHTGTSNQSVSVRPYALTDKFVKVKGTFTKLYGAEFSYIMLSSQDGVVGDWFEVKNVQLEKGNKATDWSPAPEDTAERISKSEAAIIINANSIEQKASKSELTNKVDTSVYNKKVGTLTTSIDGIEGRVENTKTITDNHTNEITSYNKKMADFNVRANAIESNVSNVTDDVNGISENVGNLTVESERIAAEVTSVNKNLDGKITDNSSAITQTAETINQRITSINADYETDKTGILSGIQKNESAIDSSAKEIALRVTNEELKQGIADIDVGGMNLVQGTEFTNKVDTSNIGTSGSVTLSTQIMSGSKKRYLMVKNETAQKDKYGGFTIGKKHRIPLSKGVEYTLSFVYRTSINSSSSFGYLWILDPDGNYRVDTTAKHFTAYDGQSLYKITGTFKAQHSNEVQLLISQYPISSGNSAYLVQDIQLEKGNKATEWSPAPEDAAERISKTEAQIKVNKDAIELTATKAEVKKKLDTSTYTQDNAKFKVGYDKITSKVTSNETKVNTHTGEIESAKSDIASIDTKADGILSQVSSLDSDMTTANRAISAIDQKADSITSRVSDVRTDLEQRTRIKDTRDDNEPPSFYWDNYNKETIHEFKRSVTIGISGTTYGILETIIPWSDSSGGSIKQTFNLEDKAYKRKGTTTKWSKWVETESTAGAQKKLKDAIDPLTGRMVKAETAITQTPNNIKLAVKEGVADIQVGARNLLQNSGDFTKSEHGHAYVVKDGYGTLTNMSTKDIGTVELEASTEYTVSAIIMFSKDTVVNSSTPLHYHIRHGGSNTGGRESVSLISKKIAKANVWERIELRVVTKNLKGIIFAPIIYGVPVGTTAWLRSIKVEKGNKATDWTTAPEDTVYKTNVLSSINLSKEGIDIKAKMIDISGLVSFINADGTAGTMIDGDKLVNKSITTNELNVNQIFANSAVLGLVQALAVKTATLSATKITTGTLDAGKISVANLSASVLTAGTIDAKKITVKNLNASNINAGSLSAERISAGTITKWGTLAVDIRNGGIETYKSGKKTSVMDGDGQQFYRDNKHIGNIGTNSWVGDSNYRGLTFDMTEGADYMAWAHNYGLGQYTTQLSWHRRTTSKADRGFTFSDEVRIDSSHKLGVRTLATTNFTSGERLVGLWNYDWDNNEGVAITNGGSNTGMVWVGANKAALSSGGNTPASIEVGKDGSGNYVRSTNVYFRTYSNAPNMYVTSYGTIGRSTSASKYKLSIENQFIDTSEQLEHSKQILDLDISSWFDKAESEICANESETGESYSDDKFKLGRHVGLIAEHVESIGLSEHVSYGADGDVEGIEYDRLWIHLIPLMKQQQKESDEQKQVNKAQQNEKEQLKTRLNKIESQLEQLLA